MKDENSFYSLIQEYRVSIQIEKKKIIKKLNQLIDNDELVRLVEKNNNDMQTIVNDNYDSLIANPNVLSDNKKFLDLFYENLVLYTLANYRQLNVGGLNFMQAMATAISFKTEKTVLDENKLTKRCLVL